MELLIFNLRGEAFALRPPPSFASFACSVSFAFLFKSQFVMPPIQL